MWILYAFSSTFIVRSVIDFGIVIVDKGLKGDTEEHPCYYFNKSLVYIIMTYVYDFFPVLLIQLLHIRNFKEVR